MNALRRLSALAAGVAVAAVPAVALAQEGRQYYYDEHMWGAGWFGWFLGPLMMVFWIALLVGAVVLIMRWLGASGPVEPRRRNPGSDALDTLRERFAKGEIDKAEFEERRALLER
jgi:putative membrane protein